MMTPEGETINIARKKSSAARKKLVYQGCGHAT